MLRFSSIFYYYYYFFLQRLCVSLKRERESPCHQLLKTVEAPTFSHSPHTHTQQFTGFLLLSLSDENAKISDLYRRACVFFIAAATRCSKRRNLSAHFFLSLDGGCLSLVNRIPFFPTTVSAQAENLSLNDLSKGGYIFLSTVLFFFDIYYITFICRVWLNTICWLSCDGLRVYIVAQSLC